MKSPIFEMIDRAIPELASQRNVAVLFSVLALIFLAPALQNRLKSRPRAWLSIAVLLISIAVGVTWAIKLSWICDDAFISFRYADNLVNGDGLVYNVGERVEGYTNFLWTMITAGVIAMGFDPGQGSIVISLLCFVLLIVLVWRMSRVLAPDEPGPLVSVAVVFVAVNYIMVLFATSGLETMAAAMFAALALERALSGAMMSAGLAGIAAAMTHPDHGILYVALGLSLASTRRPRSDLLRYAAPFFFIYIPYFLWRWNYYGDFFPNTYYTKSAGLAYFNQGGIYVLTFFIGGGFWAIIPLFLYTLFVRRQTLFGRYLIFSVSLFLLYIAKIGGDFMYGRLLSSLVAPLILSAEIAVRDLWRKRSWWTLVAIPSTVLLSITAVPVQLIKPFEKKWQIADERTFYTLRSFSPIVINSIYFTWAKDFNRYFVSRKLRPTLGMHCVGMIGYLTRLPIVDYFGLTDRDIGRRPIHQRGRPGHEKLSTAQYIVNSGALISDTVAYPEPYNLWTQVTIGKTTFHFVHYDPNMMRVLLRHKPPLVRNFERRLRNYVDLLSTKEDAEQLACDAWFFQEYYFSRAESDAKRSAIERRLLELSVPMEDEPTQLQISSDFRKSYRPDAKAAMHFNPGDEKSFTISGGAFVGQAVFRPPIWRGEVARNNGSFVSTYHPEAGDARVAHLISKPFKLVGDIMELKIAGGRNAKTESVALIVDGESRFLATGCNSDMIGSRLWYIKPYKGKTATVEIIDKARGPWGHIIVDEIVQWVGEGQ
jgi:hypothetical protein